VNILLALIARQRTGKGTHLDIAMTDHLFMLMFWAQGQGNATGEWPQPGKGLLSGGSPRYQVYQTSDGRFIAAAPIEEKFWQNFCNSIDLDNDLRASENAEYVIKTVRNIIGGQSAAHWQQVFSTSDCCCNVVKTLSQALKDNHFRYRGLFEHQLVDQQGNTMTALPVCLVSQFRDQDTLKKPAPGLGEHQDGF
ncbi:MAG TPA: CoA transferase, partial [Rhizobiales bacterium]|nr:CoA transferase [Hyphomicrobiales bacterium]